MKKIICISICIICSLCFSCQKQNIKKEQDIKKEQTKYLEQAAEAVNDNEAVRILENKDYKFKIDCGKKIVLIGNIDSDEGLEKIVISQTKSNSGQYLYNLRIKVYKNTKCVYNHLHEIIGKVNTVKPIIFTETNEDRLGKVIIFFIVGDGGEYLSCFHFVKTGDGEYIHDGKYVFQECHILVSEPLI